MSTTQKTFIRPLGRLSQQTDPIEVKEFLKREQRQRPFVNETTMQSNEEENKAKTVAAAENGWNTRSVAAPIIVPVSAGAALS